MCQFLVLAITTGKKLSSSRLSRGLCCCVSFPFWWEIGSFFVLAGKFYYDQKKKITVFCLAGCAVVSVFGSGNYDQKIKSSSRLSGGLCCCVSFWFWQEIGILFVVAGNFFCCGGKVLLRLEKKKF